MRLLLYDGECAMCQGMVRLISALKLTQSVDVLPWGDAGIDDEQLAQRIRVEILLLEEDRFYGGYDALTRLLSYERPFLARLARLGPVQALGRVLYPVISLNRRILSPIGPREIPCACDPPADPAAREQLFALLILVALSGFLTVTLAGAGQVEIGPRIGRLLLINGLGWVLSAGVAWLILKGRFKAWLEQALVILALGSLWLYVGALALVFARLPLSIRLGVCYLQPLLMFLIWLPRNRALRFPRWLPWLWLGIFVGITAVLFQAD